MEKRIQFSVLDATFGLALAPPALVVLLMQRWFVKGLLVTEK